MIFDSGVAMYCLAHRRPVTWLAFPMWWHHTDDLRFCSAMWCATAPRVDGTPLRLVDIGQP